jgi:hypothetical protein
MEAGVDFRLSESRLGIGRNVRLQGGDSRALRPKWAISREENPLTGAFWLRPATADGFDCSKGTGRI